MFKIGQLMKLKLYPNHCVNYDLCVFLVVTMEKNNLNRKENYRFRLYNLNTQCLHFSVYKSEDIEIL
jgi:hypothetical protein